MGPIIRRSIALLLVLQGATPCAGKEYPAPTPPRFGGYAMRKSFRIWLSAWRNLYADPAEDEAEVPLLEDSALPPLFKGVKPKVVHSTGGFAGGVVSEGMGYALMIEGMLAAQGDAWAKDLAMGLLRSWLGMVQGINHDPKLALGGASEQDGSALKVDSDPYGVSAIDGWGPAGVATWKFPRHLCAANDPWKPCHGSAADGDVDAVLGAVYIAGALNYPIDLVDIVVRLIITFASADLGFPDMYRTLPDGKRIFVPKAGSQWGGLTPPDGKFKTLGPEWCYNPAYFAPAHYRTFKQFLSKVWDKRFEAYLPKTLDGKQTQLSDLTSAFDGAILAGYNILYYSSCESGTVSNWVGVMAPCETDDALSCKGVPWQYTPFVGKDKGECSTSGTRWGTFGADAGRTFWRLAMDYVLHTADSERVDVYWRSGWVNQNITFNARLFLNRIVTQYRRYASCDGGNEGGCDCHYPGCIVNATEPFQLAKAFASDKWPRTPGLTCDAVPHHGQAWWAGFMAYPTFTAFVAPYDITVNLTDDNVTLLPLHEWQHTNWMETFAHICNFSNFTEEGGWKIFGKVCQTTYFHVSQETISTMVMSDVLRPLPEKRKEAELTVAPAEKVREPSKEHEKQHDENAKAAADGDNQEALAKAVMKKNAFGQSLPTPPSFLPAWLAQSVGAMSASVLAIGGLLSIVKCRRNPRARSVASIPDEEGGPARYQQFAAMDLDGPDSP
mmetsp:Transcript_28823/g.83434  ORF Transcript_28823/g.83434 Transcript_28823/m.83434 type:complete len:725 (+) Transcript_28823:81-2255(+)